MSTLWRPGDDHRLVAVAAGAWASTAACTYFSPRQALGCAAAGSLVTLVVGRRVALVSLLALGVVVGAASAAWHVHALRHGLVATMASRHAAADVIARLVRDPVPVTSRSGVRLTVVDATVTSVLAGGWRSVNAPVVVLSYGDGWEGLLPGQRVEVVGTLAPPMRGDDVAAVVDARAPPTAIGRPPWWERAAGRVRAALRDACNRLPADERGLLPGLVDGDVAAEPSDLTAAMRVTGLTHLQAVSGENVSIVVGVVLGLARALGLRRRSRVVLAGVGLVAFVVLARPSPSVQRAAVMGALVVLAMATGRRARALPSLAVAVFVLVCLDPFLARSVGFVLSVCATAAIVLVAPRWAARLSRHLPAPVATAVAVPAAAQLACTPVLVLALGQLTPYAIPANALAGLAVVPATVLGVAVAVLSTVSVAAAIPIAWLAAVPAAAVALIARLFAGLPGAGVTCSAPALIAGTLATAVMLGWRAMVRKTQRADGAPVSDSPVTGW